MTFKSAKNFERKLRLALIGPPKSGKSFTALTLASALAGEHGRVAVIDTENASAAKYAEVFPSFDVSELDQYSPDEYVREIHEAERLGYDVLIIDSLSHAWNGPGGLLELKEQIAKRPGFNSYTAWSEASPKHTKLMHAITHSTMHVIVTMRTKVEYVMEQDERGKTKPVRVGLAPIQKDETEYEFDIMGMMDRDHNMSVEGSRCPELDNVTIARPDASVAETIKLWLSGAPVPVQQIVMKRLLREFYDLAPTTYARIANWQDIALRKALELADGEPVPTEYTDDDVARMDLYVAQKRKEKTQKAS